MAYHEKELKVSEADNPNLIAVYTIIFISLATLAVTMFALAEYKGYLDTKRQTRIQGESFKSNEKQEAKNAAGMKVINQLINEK